MAAPWWSIPLASKRVGWDPVTGEIVRRRQQREVDVRDETNDVVDVTEPVDARETQQTK